MKMEFSTKDILIWRMAAAVSWSILFQFFILCAYVFVVNLNMWNPLAVGAAFDSLLSSKLLYIFPIAAVVFTQGVLCSRDYLRQKSVNSSTRFSRFIGAFSIRNLVAVAIHVALGFTISSIYSSISSDSVNTLFTKCNSDDTFYSMCLNEKKFFLVLGGSWIGFYTFMKEHIFYTKHIIFPPVQQHKFFRIGASLAPSVVKSISKSVLPCLLFITIYYLKGGYLRSQFYTFAAVSIEDRELDTVFILFEKELLIYMWLMSTIFFLTLDVMETIFNIHITERTFFPITTFMLPSNDYILLKEALSSEKTPIIQHLGFLDLALLSQHDAERRAELFTLSQPGGHPHSWNAVVCQCLKVISDYLSQLKSITEPIKVDSNLRIDDQKKPELTTPDLHSGIQYSHKMRRLGSPPLCETEMSAGETFQQTYEKLICGFNTWLNAKIISFYKKPIVAYFFGDMNEPKVKQLIFQSQPVIWAVETLSFLTCKSLKEDSFGVAQKDVASIITLLINLKQCVEKLQKQSIFLKKSKLNLLEIQMKNALKFSLKQSIYRITITFKTHIKDIALPMDIQNQVMNFVTFKEV